MSLKNFLLGLLWCTFTTNSWAEITLDGSFGRSGALSGPDYAITADLGKSMGGNLFHSFRDFNLSPKESATFSGPNTINNIISRVTGGNRSQIHGLIRSTIPDAEVYLLNPAGILFGEGAKLDLQGGFHASTADILRLGNEGEFNASNFEPSILTVAAPSAFGFLKDKPAAITLQESQLAVPTGKNLSLIGGDLNLNGVHTNEEFSSKLSVESGRLHLASLSSPGEVIPTQLGLDINSSISGGTITANGTQMEVKEGGQIFIHGEQLRLVDSQVKSETTGDNHGAAITIQVGTLHISDFGEISSNSGESAQGNAGNIEIQAEQVTLTEVGQINSNTHGSGKSGDIIIKAGDKLTIAGLFEREGILYVSGIYNQSFSQDKQAKPVGNVEITAREIVLSDLGQIVNLSAGTANGGSIVIKADDLTIMGTNENYGDYNTTIINVSTSEAANAGPSGDIKIEARQVTLKDGAAIRNVTLGTQATGPITLVVSDRLTIQSSIIGTSKMGTGGKSGDIKIEAGQLTLRNGGQINASTVDSKEVGSIVIKVIGTLTISDTKGDESIAVTPSGIFTSSTVGNAGNIKIAAEQIILTSEAEISSSSCHFEDQTTCNYGKAGNIEITAHQMKLDDYAKIFSKAEEQGESGTILINLAGNLMLSGYSNISTSVNDFVDNNNAGEIQITAQEVSLDDSMITSNTTGKPGTITLDVKDTLTIQSSEITTRSEQSGNSGKIDITARQLNLIHGGPIRGQISSNTSGSGNGGNITLNVSDTLTVSGKTKDMLSGRIFSGSIGSGKKGDAGTISVKANKINLIDGGEITTSAFNASGGNINLTVPNSLFLHEGKIRTNVINGEGDGGEIKIAKPDLVVLNNSRILTTTDQGQGGKIAIRADKFIRSVDSLLDASSRIAGRSGEIKIEADSYVGNGLITLPANFSNPPSLHRCETRFIDEENRSRFTRVNRAKMRRDELKEGVWGSPLDF